MADSPVPPDERLDFDTLNCLSGGRAEFRAELEDKLHFMVYRQSRVDGVTVSDWVQVSPLIDYAHFDREAVPLSASNFMLHTLNDPYVKVAAGGVRNPTTDIVIWFVDRYPMFVDASGAAAREWRYQLVYFDKDQRPVAWRGSDWFGADGL